MSADDIKRIKELINKAKSEYNYFVDIRERLIKKLNETAKEARDVKQDDEVVTAGAALTGVGLIPLFLPLLIPGVIMMVEGRKAAKRAVTSKLEAFESEVKEVLKKDSSYYDDLKRALEALAKFCLEVSERTGSNALAIAAGGLVPCLQEWKRPRRRTLPLRRPVFINNYRDFITDIKPFDLVKPIDAKSTFPALSGEPSEFAEQLRKMAEDHRTELKRIEAEFEKLRPQFDQILKM